MFRNIIAKCEYIRFMYSGIELQNTRYPIYVFRNIIAKYKVSDLCIPEYNCKIQGIRFIYSGI
jgi:hypothetical protein